MRLLLGFLIVGCGDNNPSNIPPLVDSPAFECPFGETAQSFATRKYGTMGGTLDGVTVCVAGTTICTTSAVGLAVLCVPVSDDYGIRLQSEGFEDAVYLIGADASGLLTLEIGDEPFVTTLWAGSGVTFPPTTNGLLFVGFLDEAVTVTISPSVGTVTYGDATAVADATLTATSSSGTVYIGDLPAGDYDVTVAPPATCTNVSGVGMNAPKGGWASPTAGAATRVPVFAGVSTVSLLDCQ